MREKSSLRSLIGFICASWTGEKFGFDGKDAMVTNEEGSEIESFDVIRDNDKLFFVEQAIDAEFQL